MAFDRKLLEILACPVCKGALHYDNSEGERLICRFDRLAYPIVEDIPVLIEEEAKTLTSEELPK